MGEESRLTQTKKKIRLISGNIELEDEFILEIEKGTPYNDKRFDSSETLFI